jgi:hypothetical protein
MKSNRKTGRKLPKIDAILSQLQPESDQTSATHTKAPKTAVSLPIFDENSPYFSQFCRLTERQNKTHLLN